MCARIKLTVKLQNQKIVESSKNTHKLLYECCHVIFRKKEIFEEKKTDICSVSFRFQIHLNEVFLLFSFSFSLSPKSDLARFFNDLVCAIEPCVVSYVVFFISLVFFPLLSYSLLSHGCVCQIDIHMC